MRILALSAVALIFSACSTAPDEESQKVVSTESSLTAKMVATTSNLPACDSTNQGVLYYVVAEQSFEVCGKEGYTDMNLQGPKGLEGNSCSGEKLSSGDVVIRCGGVVMDTIVGGLNGLDGTPGQDGENCIGEVAEAGLTLTCGDSVYNLGNLVGGVDGVDGENGTWSGFGIEGVNGDDCTGSLNGTYDTITITCGGVTAGTLFSAQDGIKGEIGDIGNAGSDGKDGTDCNGAVLSNIGIELICGSVTDTILFASNGVSGTDGNTGRDVEWLGESKLRPTSPKHNEGFYWSTAGVSCLYDSTSFQWKTVARDVKSEGDCNSGGMYYSPNQDMPSAFKFPWVQIGNQIWQAKGYVFKTDLPAQDFCYNSDTEYCNVDNGFWYDYTNARLNRSSNDSGSCPVGWHLPTKNEWDTLLAYVDLNNGGSLGDAALSLKATTHWTSSALGTDAFGFRAIPAGFYNGSAWLSHGDMAYFWVDDGLTAAPTVLRFNGASTANFIYNQSSLTKATVRCILN